MNNTLINDTNAKLNEIIEEIRSKKENFEEKLAKNQEEIDAEYSRVNEYKSEFNEAKKKIQKMTDDINGFESDYNSLVEKFKNDELSNILSGVSKEIDAKIKEKKRNIQKDQDEMNLLVDKAKEAKAELEKLLNEKVALELVLRQINDVYRYYDEEFERIATFTQENANDLHPDDDDNLVAEETNINLDDLDINEDEEVEINIDVEDEPLDDENESEDDSIDDQEETEEEVEDDESLDDEENDYSDEEIDDDNEETEETENTDEDETEEVTEDENTSNDEDYTKEIEFNINKIVANDDLDDDDESSIRNFLNKDENDLF